MNDQEINCKLRERMLSFWIATTATPVTLLTYEQSQLSGTFCSIDSSQEKLQISQLHTPTFTYGDALVRAKDILHISVKAREIEEGEVL